MLVHAAHFIIGLHSPNNLLAPELFFLTTSGLTTFLFYLHEALQLSNALNVAMGLP